MALQMEGKSFLHAVDIHKSIYNASRHDSTKFSPNMVHFARELSLITDTFDYSKATKNLSQSFNLLKIFDTVNNIYKQVYENIISSQDKNRLRQQKIAKLRSFKVQDIVYLKPINKFKKKLTGPYFVKKILGPVLCSIQRYGNMQSPMFTVHIDRLFLATPRPQHLNFQYNNNTMSPNLPSCNSSSGNSPTTHNNNIPVPSTNTLPVQDTGEHQQLLTETSQTSERPATSIINGLSTPESVTTSLTSSAGQEQPAPDNNNIYEGDFLVIPCSPDPPIQIPSNNTVVSQNINNPSISNSRNPYNLRTNQPKKKTCHCCT